MIAAIAAIAAIAVIVAIDRQMVLGDRELVVVEMSGGDLRRLRSLVYLLSILFFSL